MVYFLFSSARCTWVSGIVPLMGAVEKQQFQQPFQLEALVSYNFLQLPDYAHISRNSESAKIPNLFASI